MDNNLATIFETKNFVLPLEKEITADVMITVVQPLVTMTFELKESSVDSFEAFELLLPKLVKKYNLNEEEITDSFFILKPGCFTINFIYNDIPATKDEVIEYAKNVLLKYKVKENEIISLSYSNTEYWDGKGILKVKLDIGYDEDESAAYKHAKFLKKRLEEALFVRTDIDLT